MHKKTILKQILDRLPEDIQIADETSFEFAEDEFIAILSWIQYFNWHYDLEGKNGSPAIQSPIISKRIRLDFSLYWLNEKKLAGETGFLIYILPIIKYDKSNKSYTVKEIINTIHL
jgi:CRISPR/Cas system-associated exonuclease Cas4 (RecB family)